MKTLKEEAEFYSNIESNLKSFVNRLIIELDKKNLNNFCVDAKLHQSVFSVFLNKGTGINTKTIEKLGLYAKQKVKKGK